MISEAEFMQLPRTEVQRVAPTSIVYAAAGTRRHAALCGIDADSDEYAAWSRLRMLEACQLLFDCGVQHIFTLLAGPGQFREVGNHRERLLDWIESGIGGDAALADFRTRGWRVRLHCGNDLPQLDEVRRRVARLTGDGRATIWFQVVPDLEAPWRWIFEAVAGSGVRTRTAAIRALYGEDIPLISFFLGFGKPVIGPDLLPPLLADAVQCYWTQRPGYSITEAELRGILYDYAYARATWRADKTGRAHAVLGHAAAWERGPVLGVGRRLGPFWYPKSVPSASGDEDVDVDVDVDVDHLPVMERAEES